MNIKLPWEVVHLVSLKVFKNRLEKHLSGMMQAELVLTWGRSMN